MISLNKKQQVLLAYFQENESQRQIAKRLDLSRNTVKKYIDQELVAKQQDTRNLPITNNYVSPPSYKKRKSSRSVLTTSIQKKIRYMIKQNQCLWQNENEQFGS
ncbi:sigma factor-like helix-turn-helix DNA-binding protein [Savagea faecisuis]|uniref:Sigma factor-like helix-turn-helix DNA-binding protein n=1 Tax=Savagea faecisuis TaxID=1274803 RepID=A0ABW3GT35_9BACL